MLGEYAICIRLAATNGEGQVEATLRISYDALLRWLAEEAARRYEFRCTTYQNGDEEWLDFEAKPLP